MSNLAFSASFVVLRPIHGAYDPLSRLNSVQSSFITKWKPVVAKRSRSKRQQVSPSRVFMTADASGDPTESDSSNTNTQSESLTAGFDFRKVRRALVGLSLLGFAETSYLTFNKLFSSPGAICGTQGCLDVLSGPFSSFLGIPLTLFGALAYGAFAYLAVWPLAADDEEAEEGILRSAEEVYAARDAVTRPLLLALSTLLFMFSAYLMALLVFVIQSMCPYCVFSAVLSATLFTLTAFVGRAVPNLADALRVGAAASAIASVAAAVLFFIGFPAYIRAQPSGEQSPPAITMRSTSDTLVSLRQPSVFQWSGALVIEVPLTRSYLCTTL